MQIDQEDEFSRYLRLRWTRGDADRTMRPDAERYMRPDRERYVRPAYLPPPYRKSAVSAGQADASARPLWWLDDDEVAQIRCELASLRLELALLRFAAGGRKALHHSNFQPRVPAGNPDGGQWTDGGGGVGQFGLRNSTDR